MRPNKIYIEGLALVEGHFSGIGQYTLGILQGIDQLIESKILEGNRSPRVYVIIPYDTLNRFLSFNFKHIGYKRLPISFRLMSGLWHRGKMPPLDLFFGKGTYIFTRFVDMPLILSKSYVVIYDLSFELYKQYSDDKNSRFLSKGVRKTISKSKGIITISKSVKNELVEFYKYNPKKIVVAYPAADQNYFYRRGFAEIDQVKNKYHISGDYILSLSNLEPRKNLDGLVDAYCNLPASITKNTGLLLVGVNGWKTEMLFEKIRLRVSEGYNIMRPSSFVSDEDKPAIISGAKLLAYPSHYEGFGMPPLEALACGVPVITSNNSSLPEVVGDTGTMIESTNSIALSDTIKGYLEDISEIKNKAKVVGPIQANNFSWFKSAQIIIEAVGGFYK